MSNLITEIINKYRGPFDDIYSPYFEEVKKYKYNNNFDCNLVFVLGISFGEDEKPNSSDESGFLD